MLGHGRDRHHHPVRSRERCSDDSQLHSRLGPIRARTCSRGGHPGPHQGSVAVPALFFHNYSTWRGKQGIYLEDLYVPEQHRGVGIGELLLATLARIAETRGCPRLEWQVLDWNTPAINFYETLGAKVMNDWLPCRLQGPELSALAIKGATVT